MLHGSSAGRSQAPHAEGDAHNMSSVRAGAALRRSGHPRSPATLPRFWPLGRVDPVADATRVAGAASVLDPPLMRAQRSHLFA